MLILAPPVDSLTTAAVLLCNIKDVSDNTGNDLVQTRVRASVIQLVQCLLFGSAQPGLFKQLDFRPGPAWPVSLTFYQLDFHYHFPKSKVPNPSFSKRTNIIRNWSDKRQSIQD